jgi:dipeptidyl aminopeptidase/acylaminoacyl peptidase
MAMWTKNWSKARRTAIRLGNARYTVALCCFLLVGNGSLRAQTAAKHPFGLEDYSNLHWANAVDVSPDGKMLLYQVSNDGTKGPTKHEWHLIGLDGSNDRKLDLPEHFTPSGYTKDGNALYGSYTVEDNDQLGIIPLAEGKVTQILTLPNGIDDVAISPDGTRFAVVADPRPVDPLAKVRTVVENNETSLYVVGVHGENGAWWCADLKNVGEIAWSADSKTIAVLSGTPRIGHHEVHASIDVCSAAGTRHVADISNSAAGIAWTGGGNELAFTSSTNDVLTPEHLWTVPSSGGKPVDRTPDLNGTAVAVKSDSAGDLWVQVQRGVQPEVDSYRDGKLEVAYRWPGGSIFLPHFSPFDSSASVKAFTVDDPSHTSNVAVNAAGGLTRITHQGDDTLGNVALGEVRAVDWTAKDGTELQGIVTFPADYQAGKKYRFLNLPHGGPEANDVLSFDNFARMIAGMGYVVMQPEYRGSTGYGSAFLEAIYQHFGDRAYSDVDSATDFAIAQGWADPHRLAMFGWSAGGFMTSWTVTQTHRYNAAIEGAGITDWLSFIPTSDIGQVDYDARWQENDPTPFLKFSAVMFANQVTTPLLILHGEADRRVPAFQGREFFVLLAERGKTVRMVTYPGSPHFPKLAEQRRNIYQELAAWLQKYNP